MRKKINLTNNNLPNFSYLLGVLFGNLSISRTTRQNRLSRIDLNVNSVVFAKEVKKNLEQIGLECQIKKKKMQIKSYL
jgi:intein-encoded DNA endonuclease-like protein